MELLGMYNVGLVNPLLNRCSMTEGEIQTDPSASQK